MTQPNDVPFDFETIPQLLARSVERFGDDHAIEDGNITLTFKQLQSAAHEATRALMACGIEKGDRVAIWAPNVWEWVVAALGIHGAGGVLVPINTRFKGTEASYVLSKSGAKVLFTVQGFLGNDYVDLLRGAVCGTEDDNPVSGLPTLERIIMLRGDTPEGTIPWAEFVALHDMVDEEAGLERAQSVGSGDLSDILFTSGTTGSPKGVMTSHGQNLKAFYAWTDVIGLQPGDRYLIVNPFFHAFGYKAGWLSSIMRGVTIVPHPVFDANQVLKRIGEERITMLPGPPSLFQTILANPDLKKHDLSTLRLCVTGAASIPVDLILSMREDLNFDTIITGYGLTEACGIATMCRYDDDPETIAQTSGRAIPDVEVVIVDADGKEVPRGEPGELVVRGYNVMQGYFDDDGQTKETIDSDGWLHTGDIAVMNERGYIRITDRKKDMYIMGGFNCYPAEIESLLLKQGALMQAAVVGVPDERMGEVGMAFCVLKEGQEISKDDLHTWCRDNMANYKVPRYITFVDALPLNATGKVQKFKLRDGASALLEESRVGA